jgi:4'-phosphopantetheinyl transferase EntD
MIHSTDLSSHGASAEEPAPADASLTGVARLAPEVAAMLPPGVVAATLSGEADPTLLLSEERRVVQHVERKRLRDYAAGRLCVRAALRELGIEGFALLPGADRQPLWPHAITGSITHTEGYCIAAVAHSSHVRSLGVDCEVVEAVHEELWPRICCPQELDWLARQPADQRHGLAALFFAAKESFYKCQYPLTREWLGFHDVMIELLADGELVVRPQRSIGLEAQVSGPLRGAFRFHGRWVTAGIAIT